MVQDRATHKFRPSWNIVFVSSAQVVQDHNLMALMCEMPQAKM